MGSGGAVGTVGIAIDTGAAAGGGADGAVGGAAGVAPEGLWITRVNSPGPADIGGAAGGAADGLCLDSKFSVK